MGWLFTYPSLANHAVKLADKARSLALDMSDVIEDISASLMEAAQRSASCRTA